MKAKTIEEVVEHLDTIIQDSKREENPLGYFAALYRNVTVTVKDKLHTNYFDDDERMERLDVTFANRYLAAYTGFKEGKDITGSWKYAFLSAENKKLIVLQHLLLGMNTHINLDLGVAAAEISEEGTLEDLHADFNKINVILSSLVDEVQRDLAEIWPRLLFIIKHFKKVDDFLVNFSMKIARNEAWRFAKLVVGKNESEKAALIKEKDSHVIKLSERLTNYGILLNIVFAIIRIGERGSVSDKIKALEKLTKKTK